jgi:hypothetical protein
MRSDAAMAKRIGSSRLSRILAILLAVGALAGCSMSDDRLSSFLVAPGHYVLFQCDDIQRAAETAVKRKKELEQLSARASTSAAGEFISASAYGTEYASIRGQLQDLRAAAAEKHCNFVPGETPPASAEADKAH